MTRAAARSREELEELIDYYEDLLGVKENLERVVHLKAAFRLPPGPTWLLSRLVAADGRLYSREALIDHLPAADAAADRSPKLIDVYMVKLRDVLGAEAFETVRGVGFRLTPMGRLRIKRALGQEVMA